MVRLNDFAGADRNSNLDNVLELSNIAGPAMPLERADRILTETQILPPLALRVTLHKVVRENRNVSIAFAERRELQARDVEAVEQVGAEATVGDRRLERRVRARDDSGVKGALLGSAETPKTPVFDNAQELCLEFERKLDNLVEKDGARSGDLEQSALQRSRIGERARLMTEQLTLEERLRNCRAIDRHEGLRRARAGSMNAARKKLLSRPRLTNEQYGHAATRRHLSRQRYHLAEGSTLTDYVRVPAVRRCLLRSD